MMLSISKASTIPSENKYIIFDYFPQLVLYTLYLFFLFSGSFSAGRLKLAPWLVMLSVP